MEVYIVLAVYLLITLVSGFFFYTKSKDHPDDYFLAGRQMGPWVLFFTLVATNFSAFFFLGFAGAGYRIGYSYYVMMSFGTAFAAISMYLIGSKSWVIAKEHGIITPPELIGHLSKSKFLKYLYFTVMLVFTLPYLALQPIGAGIILETLTGGSIPYFAGAAGLTVFIVFYVFLGGMRSVAITDLIQGILMFALIFVGAAFVVHDLGGLSAIHEKLNGLKPELFTRAGSYNYFSPQKWTSYMLLWFFCVPMFPHMFMRFFVSKDMEGFRRSTILYGFVPVLLFILPVMIGVMGHLSFPSLEGQAADQILPLMMEKHAPAIVAALVSIGALAAFMSTLDSQLLALSTMVTRDLYLPFQRKKNSLSSQVKIGKLFVVLLAILGLAIAYDPPGTIFAIAKNTFAGYAVLFIPTLLLLYKKDLNVLPMIIGIVLGELIIIASYLTWIPNNLFYGFEAFLVAILISGVVSCFSFLLVKK